MACFHCRCIEGRSGKGVAAGRWRGTVPGCTRGIVLATAALLLIGLQVAAAICQLPGIGEGRLEVVDATRRGGDWGALSVLGAEGDVAALIGSLIIAVVLIMCLVAPRVQRPFGLRRTSC